MTLQLLLSKFPYMWRTFDFLFYQCALIYRFVAQFSVSFVGKILNLCISVKQPALHIHM
jgi:hypothetical protein